MIWPSVRVDGHSVNFGGHSVEVPTKPMSSLVHCFVV